LQTLVLKGMLAPAEGLRFTRTERNLLLYDGISTFTVGPDGTCAIERAITTYQVNTAGLPDPSYLDVETLATLAVLRRTLRARIAQKYPRHKLANDGTNFGSGQAIVTPSIIRAEVIALARQWEQRGWVENLDQFKADLIVERNADDPNRVDAVIPPDIINQLRVLAAQIQFRL
jgi:phage tail sheath gpL-like